MDILQVCKDLRTLARRVYIHKTNSEFAVSITTIICRGYGTVRSPFSPLGMADLPASPYTFVVDSDLEGRLCLFVSHDAKRLGSIVLTDEARERVSGILRYAEGDSLLRQLADSLAGMYTPPVASFPCIM